MRDLLQGLLIAGFTAWAACICALAWVRHRLRRGLRITPSVRSSAPTLWLVSPTSSARLHRRLVRVGASARTASMLDPALGGLADELVADAVALAPVVVAQGRQGRTPAAVRRRTSARVAELESVARHLLALATAAAHRPVEATSLRDRVRALEAARSELDDIDVAAGLWSRA